MIELLETAFGLGAIILTPIAFAPQVVKSWRTKSVDDLSWLMILIHVLANSSWLGYGIIRQDPVIIVTDTLVILMLAVLAAVKYKYQTRV